MLPSSPSPATVALRAAERTNARLGHENLGSLSAASGFLPVGAPPISLPHSHAVWDELAAQLPQLYADQTVRSIVERIPLLPAGPSDLPDQALLRAASVLGILGQACVHQSANPDARLPPSIDLPWATVRRRLGRRPDPVLSYADLIVNNWRLIDPQRSPAVRVANLRLLVPSIDNQEERIFYLTQLEILARCTPIVTAVTQAQDAVLNGHPDELTRAISTIHAVLDEVTRCTLTLIDPRPRCTTFVDPVVWAKTVAPFAVPSRAGVLGPSGTASPIINLLDAFFGRDNHDSQLGREILAHRRDYPWNWRHFITAVEGVSVGMQITQSAGRALVDEFEAAREAYVGPNGFLGRHRRKVYGYLAVGFTVGRGVTIGGFSGSPRERRWDDVDAALTAAQQERSRAKRVAEPEVTTRHPARVGLSTRTPGRLVTVSELVDHNGADQGCWIAVGGRVLDVTRFLTRHPGGAPVVLAYAGLDATSAFRRAHGDNAMVHELRHTFDIGALDPPAPTPRHDAWIEAAFGVVEMQNALRLDRSFGRGTDLLTAQGTPASAFQLDRAADTLIRFGSDYLPAFIRKVLQPLVSLTWTSLPATDVPRLDCAMLDAAAYKDRARPAASQASTLVAVEAVRQGLDEVADRIAHIKSLLQDGLRWFERRLIAHLSHDELVDVLLGIAHATAPKDQTCDCSSHFDRHPAAS